MLGLPLSSTLVLMLCVLACVEANTPIYFGFVSTDNSTSAELTPSLDVALSTINNSSSVLPGYQLTPVRWTSECNRTTSLERFLYHVLEKCDGTTGGPTILGVVGCGCTVADLPVAELVYHWNIPQISYSAANSPETMDRRRFRNYFPIHSLDNWARALQGLLSEFKWTRLAVLTDNSTRFIEVDRVIQSVLEVNLTRRFVNDSTEEVFDSVSNDYRIIFLNTYSETARDILCYAAREGFMSGYVWIVYGWYSNDWWVTSQTGGCTNDDIRRFLDDSRVLALNIPGNNHEWIIGGITMSEYHSLNRAAHEGSGVPSVPEAPLIYDAVWTLALALNKTLANQIPASNSCSSGLPLEDFSYSSANLGAEIREAVSMVNFNGASGDVMFDQNGLRQQTFMAVLQYRNGMTVEIGRVNVSGEVNTSAGEEVYGLIYGENENQSTVFPGGVPMDGTPIKVTIVYDAWLIGVSYPLAVIGLVFAFICFLFNFIFRKRRIVRLTSPNMNYFLICGACLPYIAIFPHLIQSTDSEVHKTRCYVQYWLVTIGFVMAFSAIIAKLFRVVRIFRNPTPGKSTLKDWKLLIIVLSITGSAVVLLLVQAIVPVFRFDPSLERNMENPTGVNDVGITELYCSWRCFSGANTQAFYFQIVYYIYLLIIVVIALGFAISARKVNMKVLNDSRWIAAIVYVTVPTIILMFVLTFILTPWLHVTSAIYCFGLFISSSIFLGFNFIPKMVAFVKDPKGENIFARGTTISHSHNGNSIRDKRPTALSFDLPMSPMTPMTPNGCIAKSTSIVKDPRKSVTIEESSNIVKD